MVFKEDGRVGPYGCIRSGLNVYLGPLGKHQVDQPSSEDFTGTNLWQKHGCECGMIHSAFSMTREIFLWKMSQFSILSIIHNKKCSSEGQSRQCYLNLTLFLQEGQSRSAKQDMYKSGMCAQGRYGP